MTTRLGYADRSTERRFTWLFISILCVRVISRAPQDSKPHGGALMLDKHGVWAVGQVLLIGKDWKTRALLRAQLLEEGVDVEAYESLADALEASIGVGQAPALLIADVGESVDPKVEIAQLAHWSRRIPIWIIARRTVPVEGRSEAAGSKQSFSGPSTSGSSSSESSNACDRVLATLTDQAGPRLWAFRTAWGRSSDSPRIP